MKRLMVIAAAASVFTCFGGIRATSHDDYGGNTNAWQVKRHFEKMATVTNGGAKVVWLDFTSKFLDDKGDIVSMMPDRVHPNPKGYAEVGLPALLPVFREAYGK